MDKDLQISGETAVAKLPNDENEIKAAVVLAKRFPRNEPDIYTKMVSLCERKTFADKAYYSFPRGGATVKGPGVHLARELARLWGNMRYGTDIIDDNDDYRKIRSWAWDIETNTKATMEDSFPKLVYRNSYENGVKAGAWVTADPRQLRELTNKSGAIGIRNCILELIPSDFTEDALNKIYKTVAESVGDTKTSETIKQIITKFKEMGVSVDMIERKLRHPLSEISPSDVVELRGIYSSIKDGNSKISEYFQYTAPIKDATVLNVDDLKVEKGDSDGASGKGQSSASGDSKKEKAKGKSKTDTTVSK